MSTPAVAPRPMPTVIDIGVARPRAQGQAMISTATELTTAYASAGFGPKMLQTTNVTIGHEHDGRHEPRGNFVGQPLNRRPASLRVADQLHDLSQQRFAADFLGPHQKAARAVHGAADHAGRRRAFRRESIRR